MAIKSDYYFFHDNSDCEGITSTTVGEMWLYFYYEALVAVIYEDAKESTKLMLDPPKKSQKIKMPSVSKFTEKEMEGVAKDIGMELKDFTLTDEDSLQSEALRIAGLTVAEVVDIKLGISKEA